MFSLLVGSLWLGGCGDGDKDFELNVDRMTNTDWYYNRTTKANRLSFSDENVLEINRFDRNGEIKGIDLRGAIDSVAGEWGSDEGNVLNINWKNGNFEKWTVFDCTSNRFVVNNGWGEREFVTKPSYLEQLTGDAFWVNKFEGEARVTRLGFKVFGKSSLRAGYIFALLSDEKSGQIELSNYNDVWKGEADVNVENRRVRFSCRNGADYVKFDEYITAENFTPMRLSDIYFTTSRTVGVTNQLEVTWNKFMGENVYYKIEVYSKNKEADLYFESELFPYDNGKYVLNQNTIGKINKLNKIDQKKEYVIRLTAVMLERGITFNSMVAEGRVQAVVYVTDKFAW